MDVRGIQARVKIDSYIVQRGPGVWTQPVVSSSERIRGWSSRFADKLPGGFDERGLLCSGEHPKKLLLRRSGGEQRRSCLVDPFGVKVQLNLLARSIDQPDDLGQRTEPEPRGEQRFDEEHSTQAAVAKHLKRERQAVLTRCGRAIDVTPEGLGKVAVESGPTLAPDFDIDREQDLDHRGRRQEERGAM